MSKQVAGKPEGATLLDAINDGDVEFPGRMTFMDWLKWRKSTGTRPLKKRDGVSTTLEEENALWREVMDFLHDAGEEELEEEEEEEEEEEQDVDAAGAHTGLTDEELAGLDATSVELLPDSEREAALAAAAAKSAAAPKPPSGPGPAPAGPSGPPSTAGSVPATAETLQAELRELYRPDQEPVGDYLTRLARVVLALRAYGVNVGQPELEKLTMKAEEFAKIGGDWRPTRMVRTLRGSSLAVGLLICLVALGQEASQPPCPHVYGNTALIQLVDSEAIYEISGSWSGKTHRVWVDLKLCSAACGLQDVPDRRLRPCRRSPCCGQSSWLV